jgi:hypothetical protein
VMMTVSVKEEIKAGKKEQMKNSRIVELLE